MLDDLVFLRPRGCTQIRCTFKLAPNGGNHYQRRKAPWPTGIAKAISWNVEGLGDDTTKLEQVIAVMRQHNVAIACIQETHVAAAPLFEVEGYFVILSGGVDERREYAGVGFVVAPWAKHAITSFTQYNSRMAGIRLKVKGGAASFISAYAPQSGLDFEVRHRFFSDLQAFTQRMKVHGPTFTLGDFNARFHGLPEPLSGVLGPYTFGDRTVNIEATSNASMLIEHCVSQNSVVSNTFFDRPVERRCTYYDLHSRPGDPVIPSRFAELDHVLVGTKW